MKYAIALRLLRVYHDMSARDFAELLGISKSHLSEIESGKKCPSLILVELYSSVLNIPMSSLFAFIEGLGTGAARNGKDIHPIVWSWLELYHRQVAFREHHQLGAET